MENVNDPASGPEDSMPRLTISIDIQEMLLHNRVKIVQKELSSRLVGLTNICLSLEIAVFDLDWNENVGYIL
jgi:hypothetical protein